MSRKFEILFYSVLVCSLSLFLYVCVSLSLPFSSMLYEIKMILQPAAAGMIEAEFQTVARSPLNYLLMMSECRIVFHICA